MTFYEGLTVGVAILGLVFAIYQSFKNKKLSEVAENASKLANEISQKSLALQESQGHAIQELEISAQLYQVKSMVSDAAIALHEHPGVEIYVKKFTAANTEYLNVYEMACAQYRDGKCDKSRFKKMHKDNIKDIVEKEPHKDRFKNVHTAKFKAILYVYEEFENLEAKTLK